MRKYNALHRRENNREKLLEQQTQEAIKAAKESSRRISEVNRPAKAAGMTYGQYVAKLYTEANRL